MSSSVRPLLMTSRSRWLPASGARVRVWTPAFRRSRARGGERVSALSEDSEILAPSWIAARQSSSIPGRSETAALTRPTEPNSRAAFLTSSRVASKGGLRGGRMMCPAAQNRQPRPQPRETSIRGLLGNSVSGLTRGETTGFFNPASRLRGILGGRPGRVGSCSRKRLSGPYMGRYNPGA